MMDPFEKEIRALYQAKKRLDEDSIPEFSVFMPKLEMKNPARQLFPVHKKIAGIAAVGIAAIFLFYYSFNGRKKTQPVGEISGVNVSQSLVSKSLQHSVNNTTYIWEWKSATDGLLPNMGKTTRIVKFKKI